MRVMSDGVGVMSDRVGMRVGVMSDGVGPGGDE